MKPGTLVCLKADPGRVGTITGKTREAGGRVFWQVRFDAVTAEFYPEGQLLSKEEISDDPIELLRQGRLGRPADLRKSLTYRRLSGRLANLIYSMGTTNTDFYPYQFKPVLSFLDSPSNGLLVADEVGLGKTIEAGLILTELRSRYDIKRVMVLCPAMLMDKWQMELSTKFGIYAEPLQAGGLLKRFRASQGGGDSSFTIIGSLQGLRPRKGWDEVETTGANSATLAQFLQRAQYDEALLDLLIIDEAHYLRNPESASARLGRMLRAVSENVLLLSATPIHLKNVDLYQLLNLVDEDTFSQMGTFTEILRANEPLVKTRELVASKRLSQQEFADLLRQARQHPFLSDNRQLAVMLENLPSQEDLRDPHCVAELCARLERVNLLGRVVTRTRKREVESLRVQRQPISEAVPMSEAERTFYHNVTELVRRYAMRGAAHEAFLSVMPQRQMSSSMPAALAEWKRKGSRMAERAAEQEMYEDLGYDAADDGGPLASELAQSAHTLGDLEKLYANDSKYEKLRDVLLDLFKDQPKEKVVLFSYFRPTLKYLLDRLTRDCISCVLLMGGSEFDKGSIIERFSHPEGPRVLLSSEVASEGIDLQFARFLINYDLPWNPMKIEQRIGRIDRLGQKAPKILIWNLLYKDTIDARIYVRLHERLRIFEQALGGLEGIIGEKIQELTYDLMREDLTPEEEERRIDQTAQAIENLRLEEERLESEAGNLVAHGDYILNHVKAAREMQRWITGEDLWVYVRDFFTANYKGCEFRQLTEDDLLFDIRLSEQAKVDLEAFLDREDLLGKTRLHSPESAAVRCRFLNRVGGSQGDRVENINQFHPLTRFVSHKVGTSQTGFYPVASATVPVREVVPAAKGLYAFYVDLWSVQGLREIERLSYQAVPLEKQADPVTEDLAERLVTSAARVGADWLSAAQTENCQAAAEAVKECFLNSEARFKEFVEQIERENEDRADVQARSLERHRDSQVEKLQAVRQSHLERGKNALAKATEGRIAALNSRVSQKLLKIDQGRRIRFSRTEVCVGLVRVV